MKDSRLIEEGRGLKQEVEIHKRAGEKFLERLERVVCGGCGRAPHSSIMQRGTAETLFIYRHLPSPSL
jgi:hypothetical protein